jgi:hypothetical protein
MALCSNFATPRLQNSIFVFTVSMATLGSTAWHQILVPINNNLLQVPSTLPYPLSSVLIPAAWMSSCILTHLSPPHWRLGGRWQVTSLSWKTGHIWSNGCYLEVSKKN